MEKIIYLFKVRHRIQAIKALRTVFRVGLKMGMDAIPEISDSLHQRFDPFYTNSPLWDDFVKMAGDSIVVEDMTQVYGGDEMIDNMFKERDRELAEANAWYERQPKETRRMVDLFRKHSQPLG